MDVQLVAQACALIYTITWSSFRMILYIPYALSYIALQSLRSIARSQTTPYNDTFTRFYKGTVMHSRRKPKENTFKYPVRMAVIDLDNIPSWYSTTTADTMTADEARCLAGTSGAVYVLTHPPAAGYIQNPISVYYCHKTMQPTSSIDMCIAEVTNTPWAERVTFLFEPSGESVPKSLHVSPLMDMKNTWCVNTIP